MAQLSEGVREYEAQARNVGREAKSLQALWKKLPPTYDSSFWRMLAKLLAEMTDEIAASQIEAASIAYMAFGRVLEEQDLVNDSGPFNPLAFISPTDLAVETILSAGLAEQFFTRFRGTAAGRAVGLDRLLKGASTMTQDAGRTVTEVLTMDSVQVDSYIRTLRLPSCSHCAVLAGTRWHVSQAFSRHPKCDCTNTPVSSLADVSESLLDVSEALESGKVGHWVRRRDGSWHWRNDLNKGEMEAIKKGADPTTIINAQRGMETVDLYGTKKRMTLAGNTTRSRRRAQIVGEGKRGRYYLRDAPRWTPQELYRMYGHDQLELQAALRTYGYLPSDASGAVHRHLSIVPDLASGVAEKQYTSAAAAQAAKRKMGNAYENVELSPGVWAVRPKEFDTAEAARSRKRKLKEAHTVTQLSNGKFTVRRRRAG